jgi:hypothetical protein
MGGHETKILLHRKGSSHQTKETAYRMGENLCSYTSDKGLVMRRYRELKKITFQRINNMLNKWANEPNGQFSKEEV